MLEETFFNSMDKNFYTKNPQELAIIGDLHEQITQKKNRNIEFYKNVALLCLNYIQELNGLKDENGRYILNEVITPEIENKRATPCKKEKELIL